MTGKKSPAELLASSKNRTSRKPKGSLVRPKKWHCAIPELRHKLGLTLADVAEAVGITKSGLSQIEYGADIRLTTATRLAAFFDKSVYEIWTTILQDGTCSERSGESPACPVEPTTQRGTSLGLTLRV
jgi:DNA-binding XRE family transcriptional regulator